MECFCRDHQIVLFLLVYWCFSIRKRVVFKEKPLKVSVKVSCQLNTSRINENLKLVVNSPGRFCHHNILIPCSQLEHCFRDGQMIRCCPILGWLRNGALMRKNHKSVFICVNQIEHAHSLNINVRFRLFVSENRVQSFGLIDATFRKFSVLVVKAELTSFDKVLDFSGEFWSLNIQP